MRLIEYQLLLKKKTRINKLYVLESEHPLQLEECRTSLELAIIV